MNMGPHDKPPAKPGFATQPQTSKKAVASMICGFLSFCTCLVAGLPAIILGFISNQEIKNSGGRLTGSGMATSGIVMGFATFAAWIVIAMPIALLLPAINATREAARRNGCVGNMRQMGLGVLNFEAATGRFPLSTTSPNELLRARPASNAPGSETGYSWIVNILGMLEQQMLEEEIHRRTDRFAVNPFNADEDMVYPASGLHFAAGNFTVLHCPSFRHDSHVDPGLAPEYASYPGMQGEVVLTNYFAIVGTDVAAGKVHENGVIVSRAEIARLRGTSVAEARRGLPRSDLGDGTAKTIMLSESRERGYASWYDGACPWTTALPERSNAPLSEDFQSIAAGVVGQSGINYGPISETDPQPDPVYYSANLFPGAKAKMWGPSSMHAGNVAVTCFVDNHVQAISANVDPLVYLKFVTRAGGEAVNPNFGL